MKTEVCNEFYLKIEKSYFYNSIMLPKYFKFYFSSFKLESFRHFVMFLGKLFEVCSLSHIRDKFICEIVSTLFTFFYEIFNKLLANYVSICSNCYWQFTRRSEPLM